MISDLPNRIIFIFAVNTPYYLLANLRRTPEAFFTYLLFSFIILLTGSMLWRADGAKSRTLSESMSIGAGFSALLTLYTGFVIPIPIMYPWLRWFVYINPSAYTFESLMINELRGDLLYRFHISADWSWIVLRTSISMLNVCS
jgi:ATP-binding cassette, subfamily G (WHITE), member 2, PDR